MALKPLSSTMYFMPQNFGLTNFLWEIIYTAFELLDDV